MPHADVSIIIPCYNTEPYLSECLQSALDQQGVSVQAILIDDASNDGGLEIARGFAKNDKALEIIENETNKGQSFNRNLGLERARGRYVHFLDSDDFYTSPNVLAQLVAASDDAGSDICVAQFKRLHETGRLTAPSLNLTPSQTHISIATVPDLAYVTAGCSVVYRKAFLDRHDIACFPQLRFRDDIPMLTKAFLLTDRVIVSEVVLFTYRQRAESITKSLGFDTLEMDAQSMEIEQIIFEQHGSGLRGTQDFLYLRAEKYLRAFLNKWKPLVTDALTGVSESSDSVKKTRRFLAALHALTHKAGAFSQTIPQATDLNVTRLCLEHCDYGSLVNLLSGRMPEASELIELASASRLAWAQEVVEHLLQERGA